MWSQNGWESPPQTYTHFEEDIKGYKTSYRTLSNSHSKKSYDPKRGDGGFHKLTKLSFTFKTLYSKFHKCCGLLARWCCSSGMPSAVCFFIKIIRNNKNEYRYIYIYICTLAIAIFRHNKHAHYNALSIRVFLGMC